MATEGQAIPRRERRPSTSAPIVDIQGSVSPAGVSRPKHKRTFTGFGAGEIKSVEGIPDFSFFFSPNILGSVWSLSWHQDSMSWMAWGAAHTQSPLRGLLTHGERNVSDSSRQLPSLSPNARHG